MAEEITFGELAAQYDEFTLNAIIETIRSRNSLGASAYEIHLMVVPKVLTRFNGVKYSRENLDNDLLRLLREGVLFEFAGRYKLR